MRKIIAFPAFVSSCLVARFYPERVAATGWSGKFDLEYMHKSGYVFGLAIWSLIVAGIAIAAAWLI